MAFHMLYGRQAVGSKVYVARFTSIEREIHEEPAKAALEGRGRAGFGGVRPTVGPAFLGGNRIAEWAGNGHQRRVQ